MKYPTLTFCICANGFLHNEANVFSTLGLLYYQIFIIDIFCILFVCCHDPDCYQTKFCCISECHGNQVSIYVLYLLRKVPPKLSRSQLSPPCWSSRVALTPASASGTDLNKGASDVLMKDYKRGGEYCQRCTEEALLVRAKQQPRKLVSYQNI